MCRAGPQRFSAPVLDIRRSTAVDAGMDTQLLMGMAVAVFEERDGWLWLQSEHDRYVGYARADAVAFEAVSATHVVSVPRTFVYPGADLRFPRAAELSMGSLVSITGEAETRGTRYLLTSKGEALIASHLRPAGDLAPDYVSIAETFINTPYLWGGVSGFGIDCSGLVQLSMRMAGRNVLRDTSQQEHSIGRQIDPADGLERGDLVFWKGHVAIMADEREMIHASGHTMQVSYEPLADAVRRIGYLYGQPTGYRRP